MAVTLNNTLSVIIPKLLPMLNNCCNNITIGKLDQMRKIILAIIEYRQRQADLYLRCLTAGI